METLETVVERSDMTATAYIKNMVSKQNKSVGLHRGRKEIVKGGGVQGFKGHLPFSSKQSSAYKEGIILGYRKHTWGDTFLLNFNDHKAVLLLAALNIPWI